MITRGRKNLFYGWWIVAAAWVLMFLSYGIRYSFGIYLEPLCLDFDWTTATVSGFFSIYMAIYSVAALAMGTLTDKYGPRLICTIGVLFVGIGLISTTWTQSLWQLYLSLGLLVGMGASTMYTPVNATVSKFFTKKRSLALGTAMTGISFGPFVMAPISHYFIASYGWTNSFILTGIISLALGIPVAAIIIRRSPQDIGLLPDGEGKQANAKEPKPHQDNEQIQPEGLTLREALKNHFFWAIFAAYLLFTGPAMAIMFHLPHLATSVGISSNIASMAIGIVGLAGIGGRIGFGALGDKKGNNNVLILTSIGRGLMILCLLWVRGEVALLIWSALYGLIYSGMSPNLIGLLAELFGVSNLASILGALTIAAGISGALGPWLAGYMFDIQGSYNIVVIIFGVCFLLATLCFVFIKVRKQRLLPQQ
jgi:Sugar phosphate permease